MEVLEENKDCWITDCTKVDCGEFCLKHYKLSNLFDNALLPLERRAKIALKLDTDRCDEGSFDELRKIESNIVDFIDHGYNIYIHSQQAGNGKTSWAIRLMQDYFNKIWLRSTLECHGLFISVPRLLLALKDNIDEKSNYVKHIKDNIYKADIVIWDDIGTKQSTVFEDSHLLSMIDTRMNMGMTNIFTSNLSDIELHDTLGDRLYSRIVNNSFNLEFFGADKRNLNL